MTTILAIDSACASCSVALWRDGRVLAQAFEPMQRGQSERLVPMVDEVVAKATVPLDTVDAIATTVGPGAFTGIRIGLSTARGYGLALGKPVVGVTTTRVLAAMAGETDRQVDRQVLALVETKRADIYAELFDPEGKSIAGPEALPVAQLGDWLKAAPTLLCGDGAARVKPALEEAGCTVEEADSPHQSDAAVVARLAAHRLAEEPASAFDRPPAPLYLRPPDVSQPKPLRPLRK